MCVRSLQSRFLFKLTGTPMTDLNYMSSDHPHNLHSVLASAFACKAAMVKNSIIAVVYGSEELLEENYECLLVKIINNIFI